MKRIVASNLLCLAMAFGLLTTSCGASSSPSLPSESENPVIETIMARRSIRKYKPVAVEQDKLQTILQCGINAPTGRYRQSWQVRVVQNPELLAAIDARFEAGRKTKGGARAFYGAPCLIFIAYDRGYDLSQVDCGLLGQNIILAAQSLGLGTCCLGQVVRLMTDEGSRDLLERLQLPDTHELLYAIALGYPDETPEAKSRDMTKVMFVE